MSSARGWIFSLLVILVLTVKTSLASSDLVSGNLIQFNENGAWCWYQDPRVVFDKTNGTVLISSIAAAEGVDGKARSGNVEVVAYHLADGSKTRFVLHQGLLPQDDHNAAAFLIRPDGKYVAMYAKHNHENLSYWRVSTNPHDATAWEPEQTFDWTDAINTADPADHITYHNLFYLPAENKTYDFSRCVNDDPSILVSTDHGSSWSYAGKLLTETKLGYVNGYVKYASNGTDRVDFITTEHHPRDFNNSIYHGYIQGGKLHRSDGSVVDEDLFHSTGHPQTELTKVFAANSVFNGETMTHAWTIELAIDSAGHPFGLISARANDEPDNSNFSDHRFFYIRFDGSQWQVHQLAKAGACLWDAEQDYTGLATVNPSDPNVVYISTTIDPRNDSQLSRHEIFAGQTTDNGATWAWTPITQNSTVDNLRPLVEDLNDGESLLLWFRGTMTRSQHYDSAIVGTLISSHEKTGAAQLVPASDADRGADVRIKLRELKKGSYDVFVYFWSDPTKDDQITAGLSADQMISYRSRSAQLAEVSQFSETVKTSEGKRLLYRGYLGRVEAKNGQSTEIFVHDPPRSTGSQQVFAGVSYSFVSAL